MKTLATVVLLFVAGCTVDAELPEIPRLRSTQAAEAGCGEVTGNYRVIVTTVGGDCNDVGSTSEMSVSIEKDNKGLYIFVPGVDGSCRGQFDEDTCRFQARCEGTESGKTTSTFSIDYTFSGGTFSGSLVGSMSGVEACDAQVRHEGTRI